MAALRFRAVLLPSFVADVRNVKLVTVQALALTLSMHPHPSHASPPVQLPTAANPGGDGKNIHSNPKKTYLPEGVRKTTSRSHHPR
jgi:hypothetical protein